MGISFRTFTPIPFRSEKTGDSYFFLRGDAFPFGEMTVDQIAEICSHPLVYDSIFRETFRGEPYTSESARFFIKMVQDGWKNNTNFHFLTMNEKSEVVGTVGIKSHDGAAGEIGYWASPHHPGITSISVRMLCHESALGGLTSLYAYVKPENKASLRVLEKNSFRRDTDHPTNGLEVLRFRKLLIPDFERSG